MSVLRICFLMFMTGLTGTIPPALMRLNSLRWLTLHQNKLDGCVPKCLDSRRLYTRLDDKRKSSREGALHHNNFGRACKRSVCEGSLPVEAGEGQGEEEDNARSSVLAEIEALDAEIQGELEISGSQEAPRTGKASRWVLWAVVSVCVMVVEGVW